MLVSNGGVLIVNLLIGILMLLRDYFLQTPIFGLLLFVCGVLQIVFFVVGVLSISFFVTVEMVQPEFRSSAQMIATLVQMINRSIGMVVYVPLASQPDFLFDTIFYTVISGRSHLLFYVPETKGKDFNGVQKQITQLPSIKSFGKRVVNRKSTRFDDNEINLESNDNKI